MYTSEDVARAVDGYAARVIPVQVQLHAAQVVLSEPEMEGLLGGARTIALGNCGCREKQRLCRGPVEVCLALDESAEEMIAGGEWRAISAGEALEVLKCSHSAGLIHLAYRRHNGAVRQVCSCCPCCCWFFRALQPFDYRDALAESAYVAAFDARRCDGCGVCAVRCPFGAWQVAEGGVEFAAQRCFGCGLCVSACPRRAISFPRRAAGVG